MALSTNQTGFLGRKRWLMWAAGIALAVVLLASFMSRGDVVPVRVATVERGTIRSLISTNGKVEPVENFEAHAPMSNPRGPPKASARPTRTIQILSTSVIL